MHRIIKISAPFDSFVSQATPTFLHVIILGRRQRLFVLGRKKIKHVMVSYYQCRCFGTYQYDELYIIICIATAIGTCMAAKMQLLFTVALNLYSSLAKINNIIQHSHMLQKATRHDNSKNLGHIQCSGDNYRTSTL